jgi:hypothetical protein
MRTRSKTYEFALEVHILVASLNTLRTVFP